jgi:hypothetical protein
MTTVHPTRPDTQGHIKGRRNFRPIIRPIHLHKFNIRVWYSPPMLFHAISNVVGRNIYSYTCNTIELRQPDEKLSFSTGYV